MLWIHSSEGIPELAGQCNGRAWDVSAVHESQNMEWKAMQSHKELKVYTDALFAALGKELLFFSCLSCFFCILRADGKTVTFLAW